MANNQSLLLLIALVLLFSLVARVGTISVYAAAPNIPRQITPPLVIPYDKDNFTVSISLSQDQTFETHSIAFNLTVTKPLSWKNATFNGYAEYEGLVNNVTYSIDGQTNRLSTFNLDDWWSTSPLVFSVNLTNLSDGVHNISAAASGICVFAPAFFNGRYSNQVQGSSENISFTINAPPKISLLSPENITYNDNRIPLIFTVDENVSWMAYSLNQETNVTINGNTTLTNLIDGKQNLQVYAQVPTGSTTSSGTINFVVNLPPEIELLSPNNSDYNTTAILVRFTVNKPVSWMAYSLDGQQATLVNGNTTLTNLLDGNHTLTIYAGDPAENKGSSQTISFAMYPEMAPPPPPEPILMRVGILLNAGIAIAIIASGVFAVFWFKRKRSIISRKSTLFCSFWSVKPHSFLEKL